MARTRAAVAWSEAGAEMRTRAVSTRYPWRQTLLLPYAMPEYLRQGPLRDAENVSSLTSAAPPRAYLHRKQALRRATARVGRY